ncbi:ATP-binding protein [Vibrio sp. ZSDE26]|uniref:ATP-binding protein n=1 Tax=Vibrio amylolyticus TaxID=2847292 RepID=A0A9X1XLH0_9VIBR|nr:ATP-binding protein [Vibrio amylolyticus]MCK6265142.1 ATP-binding protein [Vibrio amylolyticus]
MTQTLTLIRGLPGSGKSTLARSMEATHFEADMFFINENGDYRYDAALISKAHEWCFSEVENAILRGEDVVVSNTFVRRWEIKPYSQLAKKYHITFDVKECCGTFQNIHGVDNKTINIMKKRWQQWQNDRQ